MASWGKVVLVLLLTAGLMPAASTAQAADVTIEEAIDASIAHVHAHADELGVTTDDIADLRVTNAYTSRHNGVRHVYLRQQHRGLDVLDANLTAGVRRDGDVFHVGSRLVADITASASGRARLDAAGAALAAAVHLAIPVTGPITVEQPASGVDRQTVLSAGAISVSEIPARLAYQPVSPGTIRLAWNLEIEEVSGEHWWNVSIDAENGRMLAVHDYVDHVDDPESADDGSSYRVYARPLESPNDGDRTLETSPADPDASPYGWHDLDGVPGADTTNTRGNNVFAYADWTGTNTGLLAAEAHPANGPMAAEGGDDLTFDFPLDLSQNPHFYREAAVTNLFYWNNVIHDVLAGYGFDEAAGNFQQVNYTGEGLGGDAVEADAQDQSFVNNANFSTPPDGRRGRMQMFLWATRRPLIDGSLDAGVIVHEYGHGLSNRLTGGPGTSSCLSNDEQAGEGWSDFLAIALTALPTDTGSGRRGLGTYVNGEPNRNQGGIRPQPYSTSLVFNQAMYDTIKTQAVPHGVGWVWASMLWEVYWGLVNAHGFEPDVSAPWSSGGNNLALQLVVDGMKLQPCSPGFVDSRDGIIAADEALTEGANRCILWAAFAKRGLGVSADQGDPGDATDGSQAFDVPAGC